MLFRKLYLIAKLLGVVPVNKPKKNMKWFSVLLKFSYFMLSVYCLHTRGFVYSNYMSWGSTVMTVDLAVVIHDFLSQNCILIIPYLYRHECRILFEYLQKYSKDFGGSIVISIFTIFGSVIVNCFQAGYMRLKYGMFIPTYYPYYICNIYEIFVCTFVISIANILIGHQQKVLVNLKEAKIYLINSNVTEIRKEFTKICSNINNINILYGWQLLCIFTGAIVNILTFINFLFFNSIHNHNDSLITVTDLFRSIFYMVSIFFLNFNYLNNL